MSFYPYIARGYRGMYVCIYVCKTKDSPYIYTWMYIHTYGVRCGELTEAQFMRVQGESKA